MLKGELRKKLLKWLKLQPANKIMPMLKEIFLYEYEDQVIKKEKNSDIIEALILKIQGFQDKVILKKCNFTSVEVLRHSLNQSLYKIYLYLENQGILYLLEQV